MRKLLYQLLRLPTRLSAIPLAFALAGLVWLATKLFPSTDRHTIALVGAFGIAGALAFAVIPKRRPRQSAARKPPSGSA